MILTDYYRFEKIRLKSKMRLDCTASTHSYPNLEEKRANKHTKATDKRDETNVGDLVVYYGNVPIGFKGDIRRRADKSLSIKGENLSSLYTPDIESNLGYGDFKGTTDALLFVFHDFKTINGQIQAGGVMEIFVARGKNHSALNLYNSFVDGFLDEEIATLRGLVKDE